MNILMFIVSFGLLALSFVLFGISFTTPGLEAVLFFGGILAMTASFALPGRWLRNL